MYNLVKKWHVNMSKLEFLKPQSLFGSSLPDGSHFAVVTMPCKWPPSKGGLPNLCWLMILVILSHNIRTIYGYRFIYWRFKGLSCTIIIYIIIHELGTPSNHPFDVFRGMTDFQLTSKEIDPQIVPAVFLYDPSGGSIRIGLFSLHFRAPLIFGNPKLWGSVVQQNQYKTGWLFQMVSTFFSWEHEGQSTFSFFNYPLVN